MTNKSKGGDGGDDFDFSKYAFGKRGSKGFDPKSDKSDRREPKVNSDTGSGGSGDDDSGPGGFGDFGNFDWEPEPNDEDLRQARAESERMMATEIEGEFEDVFRSLANKIVWDIVWSMVRPDKETMKTVIAEIISCGTRQVVAQLNTECAGMDEEDKAFMSRVATRALKDAKAAFEKAFSERMISNTFAESVVKAIRKNLKK